jgi:hypothetical protein
VKLPTSAYRSRLEARYAGYLQELKLAGEIESWKYEPVTFKLAARTTYTPDFEVRLLYGCVCYMETKGYHKNMAASRVKWKCAAEAHPEFQWFWVTWVRGQGWHHEEYKRR